MLIISPRRLIRLDQFALGGICGCCPSGSTEICLSVSCSPNTIPVIGATIELYSGSTLVDSCTTGDSGCCSFTETGTYTVKVVIGGSTVYSGSQTLSGSTINIGISASSANLICCDGYAIPETLTVTDVLGSFTIDYCLTCSGFFWTGWRSATALSCSVTTPSEICTWGTPSTGMIAICYSLLCRPSTTPHFTLTRNWYWSYYDGFGTPYIYQVSSIPGAGGACATNGPEAQCGGGDDNAIGNNNTASSSAPFAISFTMADSVSNVTTDPVQAGAGDTVSISG